MVMGLMDNTSVYNGDLFPRGRRNTGGFLRSYRSAHHMGQLDAVRAQAGQFYARNLSLAQRIQYVQLCLFAKLWFVAQNSPINTCTSSEINGYRNMVHLAGVNLEISSNYPATP